MSVGRKCTVCQHPETREIDRLLVSRALSFRAISRQFGVSKDAVSRHTKEHLPELLAKGHEAEQMAEADMFLTDIRKIQVRTLLMLQEAEKSGDLRTALATVREARNNIALLAELRGQLDQRPVVNVLVSPERLLKPLAAAVAYQMFGNTNRWSEVMPHVEAALAERSTP